MIMSIKKAILPVAGLGTRFLPATKAQPKEMLPIFDTPAIQLIVQEAVEAGIEEIIFVTSRDKQAIKNHFDANPALEKTLQGKNKITEAKLIYDISNLATFSYVQQEEPLGDGHAILCARDLIADDEAVVVLFGDDIVDNPSGKNAVQQLLDVYEQTGNSVVLLEKVNKKDSRKYGMVEFLPTDDLVGKITNVVEKPTPENTPSDLAIVGKYIITPEIFSELEKLSPDRGTEMRLSQALSTFLHEGGEVFGKILEGVRFDTGDKLGFLRATLHFALKNGNEDVRGLLKNMIENSCKSR